MGIFLGLVHFFLCLSELFTGAQLRRRFGPKFPVRQPLAPGLFGCGCLSILVCILSGFQNTLLDLLTWLAGLGFLLLYGVFRDLRALHACTLETQGIFLGFHQSLGLPPMFQYQVKGRQYQTISLPCRLEPHRSQLQVGHSYPIFIDPDHPERYAAFPHPEAGALFAALLGLALFLPGPAYFLLT